VSELWDQIHAERANLADFVDTLTTEHLDTPSMCAGWRVRDVVGHVVSAAHTNPGSFFAGLVGAGFSFNRFAQRGVDRYNKGTPQELAARLRGTTTLTKAPPGPKLTWLGEVIVHSEDIRRALNTPGTYAPSHIIPVADFYKGSNLLIGAKKRIAGFTLRATDMEWSTGAGPEVIGPMPALVSAMTGRKPALADLKGDGVDQFASRF
jgi:uncharacterized protein (TIGR03083 family)